MAKIDNSKEKLEELLKVEKEKRAIACQNDIDAALKKHNCQLITGYQHWEGQAPQFQKMIVAL